MATTVTGKLNQAARTFQAGNSTGFSIRIGVKYRDPKTKQDEWTNYQAAIFASTPAQVNFYQSALVEGSIVEVHAENLRVNSYDGQNGQVLSIDMLNARLGFVHSPQGQAPQQQAPQQGGWGQPQQPQQAPQQQYNDVPADFSDEIPFAPIGLMYNNALIHCI